MMAMTWRRRLIELVCAGGTVTGCTDHAGIPCGNANPDPCVCDRTPANAPQCVAEAACRAHGGSWFGYPNGDPGTQVTGSCLGYPLDAGIDAPVDAALDGASDARVDAPTDAHPDAP
jgi:hypothetical protein